MKDGQDTGHRARPFLNFIDRKNSLSFYHATPKRILRFRFRRNGVYSYTSLLVAGINSPRIFQHMSENAGLDQWSPKVRLLRSLWREYVRACMLIAQAGRGIPITVKGLSPSLPTTRPSSLSQRFLFSAVASSSECSKRLDPELGCW